MSRLFDAPTRRRCFFGLLDDFSDALLPTQQDIDKLSDVCASTDEALKPLQQTCCHKVGIKRRGTGDAPLAASDLKPIIRLDMVRRLPARPPARPPLTAAAGRRPQMRAVQCRRVKESVNSGDGRMHTYKPTAFSRPPDDGLAADGSMMPDLTDGTTGNIRKKYEESGYHEVCLLPGQDTFQCLELAPATLGSDDIETAGRPSGEGLAPGGDTTRGSTDQSQYRSNKIADAQAQRTLRRSRALLNTCHMPGVYADGTPVENDIDACSVAALYGLQPHVFAASAAGRGYTDSSFAKCQQEAVPAIVEAYYRWKFPEQPSPRPGDMLVWWAKNRCARSPQPAARSPQPAAATADAP